MICYICKRKGRRLWRGRYRLDGQTKITEVPLRTSDKRVADQRLRDLVSETQLEDAGLIQPKSLRAAALRNLTEHLDDFVADLHTMKRSDKHVANVEFRVKRLIQDCEWKRAGDVSTDSFVTWRGRQTLAAKTLNDYLGAIASLLNWMKHKRRISDNALETVELVDTSGVETRIRRAFTDDEMERLLAVAGVYRPVYLMAVCTGLRRSELAGLLWSDLKLDATVPVVNVRKSIAKDGKDASIPLHVDLVSALRELRNGAGDEAPVFTRVPRIERFRRDLKKAGIAYVDSQGRFADFHALRKTFDTNLQRNGVSPRVVMELMRHSDIRLTMETYTDASRLPTGEAIKILPSFNG
jgi:integrase